MTRELTLKEGGYDARSPLEAAAFNADANVGESSKECALYKQRTMQSSAQVPEIDTHHGAFMAVFTGQQCARLRFAHAKKTWKM